ncbi:MAG TPA: hypothetical protein VFD50_02205 [Thermoleophilia bacterium]|nr:hypothetical protein [Thermoleophilia bacterium]
MVRVLPTIKRFFEGAASVVASPLGDALDRQNRKDFMANDLTGTARFYGR